MLLASFSFDFHFSIAYPAKINFMTSNQNVNGRNGPYIKSVFEMTSVQRIHKACQNMSLLSQTMTKQWAYHLYSVWLFTLSDLKTIVSTSTAFGLFNGVAVALDNAHTPSSNLHLPAPYQILSRAPLVLFWVWINLLPFNIDNQRQPKAIIEDALNKPWRTMPSRRLSPEAAKRLMFTLYPIAIISSLLLGNLFQCLSLVFLGFWYNDLRGADANCLVRNFINACGFICFSTGALQVAIGGRGFDGQVAESAFQMRGWWSLVIAGIVFTTVQTQDMYDQRGDALRNRKTVPLVIGDGPARWSIAIPMSVWCWVTPRLWESSAVGYATPVLLGLAIAVRTLVRRTEGQDKNTFRMWNVWLMSVYLLPLIKACETYFGR